VAALAPVALWSFDGAASFPAEVAGDAATAPSGLPTGGSALALDGDGDYAEIADAPAFHLAEGTVQLWFRAADLDRPQALFSKDSAGYDDGGHLEIRIEDGGIKVRLQDAGESHWLFGGRDLLSPDAWHMVTFVFGEGGARLYVDGVKVDDDPHQGGLWFPDSGTGNAEPITLGASQHVSGDGRADNLDRFLDGAIDDVALFDRRLDGDAVADLFDAYRHAPATGPETPPAPGPAPEDLVLIGTDGDDTLTGGPGDDLLDGGPGDDVLWGDGRPGDTPSLSPVAALAPVALWSFDGAASFPAEVAGDAATAPSGLPTGGSALALDGDGDYAEIADAPAFHLAEGTVQLWFRAADLDRPQALFSKDSAGYDDGGHLEIRIEDGGIKVRLQDAGESHWLFGGRDLLSPDAWHMVTFVFGEGGARLYVDGVKVDDDPHQGGLWFPDSGTGNAEPITLGASQHVSGDGRADNLDRFLDGAIDDVALFDRRLDGDAVADLFAAYQTGAPIPAPTGGDDVLIGGDGDDVLSGGGGDDLLDGGPGDDALFGEAGDDVLNGGAGDDTLDGGDGFDVFVFDFGTDPGGPGRDTVVFDRGADTVALQGLDPAAVTVETTDAGAVLWWDTDDGPVAFADISARDGGPLDAEDLGLATGLSPDGLIG